MLLWREGVHVPAVHNLLLNSVSSAWNMSNVSLGENRSRWYSFACAKLNKAEPSEDELSRHSDELHLSSVELSGAELSGAALGEAFSRGSKRRAELR